MSDNKTTEKRYGVNPDEVTIIVNDQSRSLTWLLANLPAATEVAVKNCASLTTMPDLPAATEVAVKNCASQTTVYGGEHRGYQAYAVFIRGAWRVVAGCRNLTFAEARQHWRNDKGALDIVAKLEVMVGRLADLETANKGGA